MPAVEFAAALTADGNRAVVSVNGTVQVWDLATGTAVGGPLPDLTCLAISSDGGRVATWDRPDGTQVGSKTVDVQVLESNSWQPVGAAMAQGDAPSAAAFGADGSRLLVGCVDGTARLWDADTGRAATRCCTTASPEATGPPAWPSAPTARPC
jgi:WD40 repeat protein